MQLIELKMVLHGGVPQIVLSSKILPCRNLLNKFCFPFLKEPLDHSTEATPTMEAIKFSDPRSFLYKKTLEVVSFGLITVATGGLAYHAMQIWLKRNVKHANNKKDGQLKGKEALTLEQQYKELKNN